MESDESLVDWSAGRRCERQVSVMEEMQEEKERE